MPVTPRFTLTQDDDFLYAKIQVPYVRVGQMEFLLSDRTLSFFCRPYLLRLTLPGEVLEDDRAKAVYDATKDNGTITIHAPKVVPGEVFEGLDMLSRLVAGRAPDISPESVEMRAAWSRHLSRAGEDGAPATPGEELEATVRREQERAAAAAESRRRVRTGARPTIEVLSTEEFGAEDGVAEADGAGPAAAEDAADTAAAEDTEDAGPAIRDDPGAGAGRAATAGDGAVDDVAKRVAGMSVGGGALSSPAALAGAAAQASASAASPVLESTSGPGCGFAGLYHGVFSDHREDLALLLQCASDPEGVPPAVRNAALDEAERRGFDAGRYVEDVIHGEDDGVFVAMTRHEPHWAAARRRRKEARREARKAAGGAKTDVPASAWWDVWTKEEQAALTDLRREAPILEAGSPELALARAQLVTMLLAAAYDERFTQGDPGPESAWALVALDPCMSWQARPASVRDALVMGARRAVTQPFLRRWDLAGTCLSDVCAMLSLGQRAVVRTLLSVATTLARHDVLSLLGRVHVEDMLLWVQAAGEDEVASLAAEAAAAVRGMSKGDLGLGLEALHEKVARIYAGEEAMPGLVEGTGEEAAKEEQGAEEGAAAEAAGEEDGEAAGAGAAEPAAAAPGRPLIEVVEEDEAAAPGAGGEAE